MKILAIETSCDETACAIVEDGLKEISATLATSKELHEKTGGVVPEVAARKQVDFILPVIEQTLSKVNYTKEDIDAVAVTVGPGLIGSLIVGIEAAKALSLAWNKPLIPVNHLIGHIYSALLEKEDIKTKEDTAKIFPAIGFVVSGGHTDLILMKDHNDLEYLGGTLDDAAGEAFDKTARLMGFSKYLGGVELSKKAQECKENTLKGKLPRPMLNQDNYDFSFSGLKTAVKYLTEKEDNPTEVVAREFEDAVCDCLVTKCVKAAKDYNVKSILLGGGVSANTQLRERLQEEADKENIKLYLPTLMLTGDNAVYIAAASHFNNPRDIKDILANPSLGVLDIA